MSDRKVLYPKPPRLNGTIAAKFMTNFFLQGCEAPFWAFVQGAAPAVGKLAQIIILPEAEDIVQEILDPNGHGEKRPARHGRKGKGTKGIPPYREASMSQPKSRINPTTAFRTTGLRHIFPVFNMYEGLNITSAIAEISATGAVDSIWGIIQSPGYKCEGLEYLYRKRNDPQTFAALGGDYAAGNFPALIQNRGFSSSTAFGWLNIDREFITYVKGTARGRTPYTSLDIEIALWSDRRGYLDTTFLGDFDQGEEVEWVLTADCEPMENIQFRVKVGYGFIDMDFMELFAFATVDLI